MGVRIEWSGDWARGVAWLEALAAIAFGLIAAPAAAETLGVAPSGGSGGEGCAANETYVQTSAASTNYAAPFDGIVTAWRMNGDWGSAAALKIVRPGGSGTYTIAASDGPRTLAAGLNTFSVRIPMRQGDTLGVYIASSHNCFNGVGDVGDTYKSLSGNPATGDTIGAFSSTYASSRIAVSAQLERDADADGYGDETQDQCPTDGTTHDACPLPTTLGQTFAPHWPTCTDITTMPLTTPAVVSAVQRDGVITSWSYESLAVSGTVKFEVLQPLGGSVYLDKADDAPHPISAAGLNTFPVRVPVRVGDRIAIRGGGIPVCGITSSDWIVGWSAADLSVGNPGTFASDTGLKVDLSAVEEPDSDGDGYGDVSQDGCPADASASGPCPVPPASKPKPKPACTKAKAKLKKARAKLKKLQRGDPSAKVLIAAKKKVKQASTTAKRACR